MKSRHSLAELFVNKGGGERKGDIHHRPPHVTGRYYSFLLALHGLSKKSKRLLDLSLLLRGDVVLFGEFGRARRLCAA